VTITIPKEILQQAGLTEQDALVEFACRLFQSKRLTLGSAVRLAAITRTQFEEELKTRGIPAYELTLEEYRRDLEVLDSLQN
jgi:predicted HTH domain antitoxin